MCLKSLHPWVFPSNGHYPQLITTCAQGDGPGIAQRDGPDRPLGCLFKDLMSHKLVPPYNRLQIHRYS